MASFCTDCGTQLPGNSGLCTKCSLFQTDDVISSAGTPEDAVLHEEEIDESKTGSSLNKIKYSLIRHNSQKKYVRISLLLVCISAALVCLSTREGNPLHREFSVTLTGIFGILAGLLVALVFTKRAKKLNTLLKGQNAVAAWLLTDQQKAEYANFLYRHEIAKNIGVLGITTLLIVVIFGAFIIFIDEGKGAMAMAMLGITTVVALFAMGMPAYYRARNRKGDGVVLIGRNCAYVNGFFHNWDFPMSGIRQVKGVDKPFRGLYIQYFYVDRTFKNTEELYIPAPAGLDLSEVVSELKKR